MKKDYIEIAGKRYRVESNWNALTAFLDSVGRNTLEELSQLDKLRPTEVTAMMAACIAEGQRLDGSQDCPSALDLGAVITPDNVKAFFEIYARQSNPQLNKEESKKEGRETEPAS